MFIKLCFNLNVGLGTEKYKVFFNPLLSSFENSQANTTLTKKTPNKPQTAFSCSLLYKVSNKGATFLNV